MAKHEYEKQDQLTKRPPPAQQPADHAGHSTQGAPSVRMPPGVVMRAPNILALQRTVGNQAVQRMVAQRRGTQLHAQPLLARKAQDQPSKPLKDIAAQPVPPTHGTLVIQRSWLDTDKETLKVWDEPVDGLTWYQDTLTHKLHYKINDPAGFSPSYIEAQGKAYTYEQWKAAGWSGEVKSRGSAEAVSATEEHVAEESASSGRNRKGAFRVFETLDYMERDPEFYEHYDAESSGETQIVIGVLDTGIVTKSDYLRGRVLGAKDSSGRKKSEAEYAADIQDYHGTKVAGQAAYGAEQIKLVDVRVQVGGMSGADNSKEIAEGITWAVETMKARVITCSVDVDWKKPVLQAAISKYPNVLFMTTAGNNDTEITTRAVDEEGEKTNALLVGGVTLEGTKHPSRGFGSGVDVMVPSGSEKDTDQALPVHIPVAVAAAEQLKRNRVEHTNAKERLNKDKEMVEKAKAANKSAQAIAREERAVVASEKKLREMEESIATLQQLLSSTKAGIGAESGVSFGLPVIANIAAKMLLINPTLSAADITIILKTIAVSEKDDDHAKLSKSGGIVDPVKAYQEAAKRRTASGSK